MSAEPQASLSVRVGAKTKRYLDGLAEKKGVGVGRVIEQIVAELQDTPEEKYYMRALARMSFLTNYFMRWLLVRLDMVENFESGFGTVVIEANKMFGPPLPYPKAFLNIDTDGVSNEFEAMYRAFNLIDPVRPKTDAAVSVTSAASPQTET